MNTTHYIGFDVHKKHISYCSKRSNGEVIEEGRLVAERAVLRSWAGTRAYAWQGAMEATLFSGWIFDTLKPYATKLEMAHPAMVKAIAAAKKKNDRIDARVIADLLRCNLLPACHVASPEIRELRRLLRYRQLVVRESVRMQNKMAGLLMECGTPFEKEKLHGRKYFSHLLGTIEELPDSVKDLLRLSRGAFEMFQAVQKQLIQKLLSHPELHQRVERLTTIDGVGEITALTWALEIGDPTRFPSSAKVMSYCGLTSALRSSADKQQRGPISKQRNHWLQTALIEAAKLAPRWNPQLAALHARELERGHRNRATLAVARKLACYLLAVDKSGQPFQLRCRPRFLQKQAEEPRLRIGFCRRSTGRFSLGRGLGDGVLAPDAPIRLFRDRPVYPNSIFVDGARRPFPQMDVWPSLPLGLENRSQAAVHFFLSNASGLPERREISVFP